MTDIEHELTIRKVFTDAKVVLATCSVEYFKALTKVEDCIDTHRSAAESVRNAVQNLDDANTRAIETKKDWIAARKAEQAALAAID